MSIYYLAFPAGKLALFARKTSHLEACHSDCNLLPLSGLLESRFLALICDVEGTSAPSVTPFFPCNPGESEC